MILPIALLLAGLLGTLFVVIKKEILQRLTCHLPGPAPARLALPDITLPCIVRIRAASSGRHTEVALKLASWRRTFDTHRIAAALAFMPSWIISLRALCKR